MRNGYIGGLILAVVVASIGCGLAKSESVAKPEAVATAVTEKKADEVKPDPVKPVVIEKKTAVAKPTPVAPVVVKKKTVAPKPKPVAPPVVKKKVAAVEKPKPVTPPVVEKKAAIKKPKIYGRCKTCHSMPGRGGKIGPDLLTSKMSKEQWVRQASEGSNWEGRPPKIAKYSNKKMPKQRVSKEKVIEIFDWVDSLK